MSEGRVCVCTALDESRRIEAFGWTYWVFRAGVSFIILMAVSRRSRMADLYVYGSYR